jgi:ATP phosphoribosyltransferase
MSSTVKIAIAKGTLFDGAVEFLKSKGIKLEPDSSSGKNRKLIIKAKNSGKNLNFKDLEILLVRGHDVPIYVEHGAADLGIVGSDVVIDSQASIIQLKDLNYGQCRLCVCAKEGQYKSIGDLPSHVRVATTFANISRDFFKKQGMEEAEIIKLYGSVELGPLTDLSDVIVDLVASGKTLHENGLEILHTIMNCSARLIANNISFQFYREAFLKLAE